MKSNSTPQLQKNRKLHIKIINKQIVNNIQFNQTAHHSNGRTIQLLPTPNKRNRNNQLDDN